MVTFTLRTNTHKIIDKITAPVVKATNENWFGTQAVPVPIEIVTSDGEIGGTIIYDFDFSIASVIEITFNGGDVTPTWAPINEGGVITGRQSRYLRVLNGDKVNFRANTAGSINRIVVGEV